MESKNFKDKWIFHKFKNKLLKYLNLHLAISLFSISMLSQVNIPISTLAIIGNFLFGPFLLIFLAIALLLLFAQLLHLPDAPLTKIITIHTDLWDKLLAIAPKKFNVILSDTYTTYYLSAIFILIPIIFPNLLFYKISEAKKFIYLLFCTIIIISIPLIFPEKGPLMSSFNKKLVLNYEAGNITATNFGLFSKRTNANKLIEYQLRPFVIKNFGTLNIKNLIVIKPNKENVNGTILMTKIFDIEKITLFSDEIKIQNLKKNIPTVKLEVKPTSAIQHNELVQKAISYLKKSAKDSPSKTIR